VIVGNGWRAVTKSSKRFITGPGQFNPEHDQSIYIKLLADWLDDNSKPLFSTVENACHGIDVVLGSCLSAMENRKVMIPVENPIDIIAKVKREL